MNKRIISIFIAALIFVSCLCVPSLAADPSFDVKLDMDSGAVSIFYRYPACSNRDIGITVTDTATDEIVYYDQLRADKWGVLSVPSITLAQSGIYSVRLSVAYSDIGCASEVVYMTESDRLNYWNTVAVGGSSQDIAADWHIISEIFGLDNEYIDGLSDDSALFDKIIAQRGDSYTEMSASNISAFAAFVKNLSLFTAVEQSADADAMALYFEAAAALMSADYSDLCTEWSQCMQSVCADDVKEMAFDAITSVNSFDDIAELMDGSLVIFRASELVDQIAAAKHISEITSIVTNEENAVLLGISDYVDKYNSLSSTSSVDKAVMKHFDTALDFAAAFKKAVDDAIALQGDDTPKTPSRTPSGGNKTSIGGTSAPVVTNVPSQLPAFEDIDVVSWAKEHIIKLYNLGVINGKSEKEFKPMDNITREEIVKLIVSMMKIEGLQQSQSFDDVSTGAWYCDYITQASAAGVVNGIGDGIFGVGLNASRQDIAVMIVNALNYKGITVQASEASFADSAAIAQYAAPAVGALYADGIVTGDENGFFNPQSKATRAEVATMLSRIYDKYLKEGR